MIEVQNFWNEREVYPSPNQQTEDGPSIFLHLPSTTEGRFLYLQSDVRKYWLLQDSSGCVFAVVTSWTRGWKGSLASVLHQFQNQPQHWAMNVLTRCKLSDFQCGTSLSSCSVVSLAATTPCQLQLMHSVGSTASVPVTTTGSSLVVFKLLWLISLACSIVYISAFVLSLLPPSFRQTKMKVSTLSLKIHALFLFAKVNCLTSCSVLPSMTRCP